jgi:hypothetical protein
MRLLVVMAWKSRVSDPFGGLAKVGQVFCIYVVLSNLNERCWRRAAELAGPTLPIPQGVK